MRIAGAITLHKVPCEENTACVQARPNHTSIWCSIKKTFLQNLSAIFSDSNQVQEQH